MKQKLLALTLSLGLGLPVSGLSAAEENMQMVGLAMHQETGRNIFLGALYSDDPAARIATLQRGDSTGVLEHRVVARRTSIRSLLGKLLLQGEVATGRPPTAETIQFADDIMSLVRGSLYAGDSLTIELTPDATTRATLNGHNLAASAHQGVFYYFLSAWIGEKGPSTAFRSAILSPSIDSGLMSVYSANDTSANREREVAAWLQQLETDEVDDAPPPEPAKISAQAKPHTVAAATSTVANKQLVTRQQPKAAPAAADTVSPELDPGGALAEVETKTPDAEVERFVREPVRETVATVGAATAPESGAGVQLAMAVQPDIGVPAVEEIDTFDAMDYSRQLDLFNNDILRQVYAEIRYPRAAVRRNLQGNLELDLTLDRSGKLVGIEVGRSSGYAMLDKSAVTAAERAFKKSGAGSISEVAIAEYGDGDNLVVVPVPVSFILTN